MFGAPVCKIMHSGLAGKKRMLTGNKISSITSILVDKVVIRVVRCFAGLLLKHEGAERTRSNNVSFLSNINRLRRRKEMYIAGADLQRWPPVAAIHH